MYFKIVGRNRRRVTEWVINGIDYAVKMKADIINLSLGGVSNDVVVDLLFQQAITNAINAGVTVVAAAGNEQLNIDQLSYPPATFPGVLTVSSVSKSGEFSSYSNYGDTIDIAAVGGEINDCVKSAVHSTKSSYGLKCGTSMAAPIVSGYVALLHSYYKQERNIDLKPSEVRRLVQMSGGLAPNRTVEFGYGVLDASKGLYIAGASIDYIPSHSPNQGGANTNDQLFVSTNIENLFLCYPNPFYRENAAATSCEFKFAGLANVEFSVFSRLGQRIKHDQTVLSSTPMTWNGRDASGRLVPKGVYQAVLKIQPTDGSSPVIKKHLITVL